MSKKLVLRPVESSNIAAVGWQDGTLTVLFRSGATYQYRDVERARYHGLLRAESKGKYLNAYIKGQYEFSRLDPE